MIEDEKINLWKNGRKCEKKNKYNLDLRYFHACSRSHTQQYIIKNTIRRDRNWNKSNKKAKKFQKRRENMTQTWLITEFRLLNQSHTQRCIIHKNAIERNKKWIGSTQKWHEIEHIHSIFKLIYVSDVNILDKHQGQHTVALVPCTLKRTHRLETTEHCVSHSTATTSWGALPKLRLSTRPHTLLLIKRVLKATSSAAG